MPFSRIDDPSKLKRLMQAVLMIEGDLELEELLTHVIEEACSLAGARYGALGVLNESRTSLEQFLTVGLSEEEELLIGARPTGRGVLGLLIVEPNPIRLKDLGIHSDSYGFPPHHPPMKSFLGLPIHVRGEVYGNIYLTDKQGAEEFSEEDEAMVEALSLAAGIALENTRLHEAVHQLTLMEDRDRIARDLHDRVIQRIFAIGMSLQSVSHLPAPQKTLDTINRAVDELDVTIEQIRSSIFDLENRMEPSGLRRSILDIAAEMARKLGTQPAVVFNGPVDSGIARPTADQLILVLREALNMAAHHSGATEFMVVLSVEDEVTLEVIDNGLGVDVGSQGNETRGLKNLESRAQRMGGSLVLGTSDGGGARLVWSVPS